MLCMFSVFDSAAKAFLRPFFCPTRGEAVRGFGDSCTDPQSPFFKHASDYTLFYVGDWDEQTCTFSPSSAPERIALATDFVVHP